MPDLTTRSSTDVPDKLYNLEIRQYSASGDHLTGKDYGTVDIGKSLEVTLNAVDDCQLVLVARGSTSAVSALGTQTLEKVQSMIVNSSVIDAIDPSVAGSMNAMPYVLHLKHVKVATVNGAPVIQSPDGSFDTRLLLKRLATRLTVTWSYSVANYQLKQLLIQSVPMDYTIVDKPESDGTYPSIVSQFTTLEISIADAVAASGSYSCWVPANVRGEKASATTDLLRTKANAPVGSTFFNFIAVNTADTKKKLDYRVYIGSGPSTDFNVYRNKDYAYTVNFAHVGIPTNDNRVKYIDPIPASENNDNLVPTANCFMVEPGGAFCFDPFAFRQNGSDVSNGTLKNWSDSEGGIAYVKLYWQTKEDGDVGDPVMGSVNQNNADIALSDHTNIVDAKHTDGSAVTPEAPLTTTNGGRIYCRTASNTTGGNGVIVAYNQAKAILWSWHVWVTDYAPSAKGNSTVTEPLHRKQKYIGNDAPDQLPMMDRNLGAMAGYDEVPGNALAMSKANGLHYQQGRKDPFASSYSIESVTELMNIYNSTPTRGMSNRYGPNGITYVPREVSGSKASSLREAYKTPNKHFRDGWCNGVNISDYWGGSNAKGLHDPCPAGWRVPTKDNFRALFVGTYLQSGTGAQNIVKLAPRCSDEVWQAGAANGGYLITYDDAGHQTYLRMTGFANSSNNFVLIGESGNIWVRDDEYTFAYGTNVNKVNKEGYMVRAGWMKADGHLVRCIQERAD